MNVIVCIKQVPEIEQVRVEEASGKVVHPPGAEMVNPFDMYAIEEGLRLKEKSGGKVTAVSVGPKENETSLREALSLGVDEAILLNDQSFLTEDPIATARVLAAGIRKSGEFDLILCGKQAVDDDSAQVAPALAEFLLLPQVLFVRKIRELKEGSLTVERTTEEGYDVVESTLPAVLSVVKEINEPRLPSLKRKMRARKAPITEWSQAELSEFIAKLPGGEPNLKSLKVSPPPPRPKGEILTGTPEEVSEKLVEKLKGLQVI